MRMKRLLVTGGAGFIGSHFVKYMLRAHPAYEIVNLDKLTYAGNLDNLREIQNEPRHRFVRGDICDEQVVNRLAKECDAIVNFAAETHVDRSIDDPGSFVRTDVYGTYVLLEATRHHGLRLFLQISTDEVYGECDPPPDEEATLKPKSPYAASKAGADRLAWSYWATFGTPVVITRCTNNYGPNQYPEKQLPLFITNAIDDQPIPIYGDGTNTRDWIFVLDHCQALDRVMHQEGLAGEVLNIGAGQERSIKENAETVLRELGKPASLIRFVTDRPGHVLRHAVQVSKIKSLVGWEPKTTFEIGIRETIAWYRENELWWRKIKSGEFRTYYERRYRGDLNPGGHDNSS
jgi:dTDP-glucose 4,6-dehydratase